MLLQRKLLLPDVRYLLLYSAIGLMFVLALVLRVSLFHIETSDYTFFVSPWYDFIRTHGGFAALKYNFANYNVPYLYLLALLTYLPIPKIVAIKGLSVVFDGVLALFAFLIVRLRYRPLIAIVAALVVVFAPTIFINSALWGQCDAIYTAFCLGSLYFALKERPGWACVFFALALSFKLQAVFFFPVLLMLLLRRRLPLKYFALIPLVFLLMLVPADVAGRSAQSLLTIYAGQISTGGTGGGQFAGGAPGQFGGRAPGQFNRGTPGQFNGGAPGQQGQYGRRAPGQSNGGAPGQAGRSNGRGSGQFNRGGFGGNNFSPSSLTLNAPSFYQWLPTNAPAYWKWIGIGLAGLFVVLIGGLLIASKKRLTIDIILKITLVFAIAIPFLLPEMHERYFFLADVVSIIFAFFFPRLFYIAVIMQACSLLSYAPYLLQTQIVGLPYVAAAVLIIAVVTLVDLILALFPETRRRWLPASNYIRE